MKSLHIVLFVCLFSVAAVSAQNSSSSTTQSASTASSQNDGEKRGPVFRATKEQVTAAQRMLKSKGVYNGEPTGTLDPDTRASIKSFQKDNGLRASGGLNRATLEKLGIELTENQKAIPVPDSSYARASGSSNGQPRRPVFRATKEQVIEVQRLLKNGGMYSGDETGKLDDPTREGLKKYQTANGLKVTGTLNQSTLEKMRIALTEKQKTGGGTK